MLAQLAPIPTDRMDLQLSMSMSTTEAEEQQQQQQTLEHEIAELEKRLDRARARLKSQRPDTPPASSDGDGGGDALSDTAAAAPLPPATHFLLLLSDSALPLGAFAFSSGLESFLAHTTKNTKDSPAAFTAFLPASVSAFASTSLPFALAAHRDPGRLLRLDDALDATVVCAVGRRASVAQGRALLSVWERCFAPALLASPSPPSSAAAAAAAVTSFAAAVRTAAAAPAPSSTTTTDDNDPPLSPAPAAHLAPLFGAVCRAAGLDAREAAAVLVLGHVKALVSAAVRAGVFGPYQAQRLLAGARVRELVDAAVRREWDTPVELAGQSVPVMDLWLGRHELLYSRIFNS